MKNGTRMKRWLRIAFAIGVGVLSLACQTISSHSNSKEKWQNLFDGKTLNGWHALPGGSWKVEDGILVGRSEVTEERHGILVSDKEYKNFEIEVVFKAVK